MSDDIQSIRERLEKATKGPWYWANHGADILYAPTGFVLTGEIEIKPSDATLIGHAPTDIAFLLEQNARLEALINTLYDKIAHGDDQHRAWLKTAIDEHFAQQAGRT